MSHITRFDQLTPLWQANAKGITFGVMLVELRQAAREFCEKTDIWAVALDAIDLVANQEDYTLSPDNPAEIVKVVSIEFDPSTTRITTGFTFAPPSTLTLDAASTPTAAKTDGLIVNVVLKPSLLSNELPPVLASWGEYIIARALYSLKIQPQMPWSDLQGAGLWLARWNSGLNRAMSRVAASGTEESRL